MNREKTYLTISLISWPFSNGSICEVFSNWYFCGSFVVLICSQLIVPEDDWDLWSLLLLNYAVVDFLAPSVAILLSSAELMTLDLEWLPALSVI